MRQAVRNETGMLVVEQSVPGGTAHGVLQPGDVLLRLCAHRGEASPPTTRGNWCTTFLQMEALVDDSVGAKIWVSGGKVECSVEGQVASVSGCA